MLQKHSKDIIFIVIILILIGIIWGVDKNIWILIAINVVVIMVGLLYVNVSEGDGKVFEKKKNNESKYNSLRSIAEDEINNFLSEVDYDDFESVKKGKSILDKVTVGDNIEDVVNKIKKNCSYEIEVYYLGLVAICMANTAQLKEIDFCFINIGVNLVNSSKKLESKLTVFIKNNGI